MDLLPPSLLETPVDDWRVVPAEVFVRGVPDEVDCRLVPVVVV